MIEAKAFKNNHLMSRTVEIVSSYVSHNAISAHGMTSLISAVHSAIETLAVPDSTALESKLTPAVPIRRSVTVEFIICLEDGKKFKSLKRHLMTHFQITPDDYRAKWNLPSDYPMVAPAYAAVRSTLAKSSGLGRNRDMVDIQAGRKLQSTSSMR